jgi:hypothetical protein
MSLKVHVEGAFLDVIVSDVLALEDLPILIEALKIARRKGPFVVLTDTLAMKASPRQVIMHFSDELKQLPSMKNIWLGDAVVISSPLARFALSTLILVAPLPTEVKVFEHREPAVRWCRSLLDKAASGPPDAGSPTAARGAMGKGSTSV